MLWRSCDGIVLCKAKIKIPIFGESRDSEVLMKRYMCNVEIHCIAVPRNMIHLMLRSGYAGIISSQEDHQK